MGEERKGLDDLCAWYDRGSTNRETLENEAPRFCLMKKCDGYNKKCLAYIPLKKVEEERK